MRILYIEMKIQSHQQHSSKYNCDRFKNAFQALTESISFDKSSLTDTQKNNVLVYEVTNHEVISIDWDVNVTGLKAGSGNVKISTDDGKLLGEVTIKVVEN